MFGWPSARLSGCVPPLPLVGLVAAAAACRACSAAFAAAAVVSRWVSALIYFQKALVHLGQLGSAQLSALP